MADKKLSGYEKFGIALTAIGGLGAAAVGIIGAFTGKDKEPNPPKFKNPFAAMAGKRKVGARKGRCFD